MLRIIQGISLREATDLSLPFVELWNMVRVSFCAVMQVEILCFYVNLAVNCHSFAVCHMSIIQWSDFNTCTLHPGPISWTCVAAARIAAAYENMRWVSTWRGWYQKYRSLLTFHAPVSLQVPFCHSSLAYIIDLSNYYILYMHAYVLKNILYKCIHTVLYYNLKFIFFII